VGGEDDGAAGTDEFVEQIFDEARRGGVEAGERFVEEHEARGVQEGAGEGEFLFGAA